MADVGRAYDGIHSAFSWLSAGVRGFFESVGLDLDTIKGFAYVYLSGGKGKMRNSRRMLLDVRWRLVERRKGLSHRRAFGRGRFERFIIPLVTLYETSLDMSTCSPAVPEMRTR